MPKTIYSPRYELICGKIDTAEQIAIELKSVELVDLLSAIRFDAERMEQKLIQRKKQAELMKQTFDEIVSLGRKV